MTIGLSDDAEVIRVRAPGRIDLLGADAPATGGAALSMAIDRYVDVAGVRGGDRVELRSDRFDTAARVALDVDDARLVEPEWGRRVAAVVIARRPELGLVGSITSTLSAGVGLASSAALEVALALALGADPDDLPGLARIAQHAEQLAGGVPAAVGDALTVVAGRRGHALVIDGSTVDARPVPLPDDVEIVVVHTGQDRELAAGTALERAAECAAAEELVGPLRSASREDVERLTSPLLRRRARHLVSEQGRVAAAVRALADGDLAGLGQLLVESHASARDDFEVSTSTADNVVSRLARTPGVFGARLTGAGFGGCVVALARPGTRLAPGLDATVVQAVDGARVIR